MASQELIKQLCARTQKVEHLPKAESMVTVSSMMSQQDHSQFQKGLASIFVEVGSQIFSVRPQQMVPKEAVIQRDEQSQIVGISAVSGG
jgi:methylmalonyl-CoA mutase cobalamin-binding subunit